MKLIEKYSFYSTLLLQEYEFEYAYFRDVVIQKITLELLQNIKYFKQYPSELDEPIFQKLKNFTDELMLKYIVEENTRKT